jgi:hypothetical protein
VIPMGRAFSRPADSTERVRELTWAVVDDHIEDAEWNELQKLLTDSAESRLAYIEAIQLHTDLLFHFKEQSGDSNKESDPVLGFLGNAAGIESPMVSN